MRQFLILMTFLVACSDDSSVVGNSENNSENNAVSTDASSDGTTTPNNPGVVDAGNDSEQNGPDLPMDPCAFPSTDPTCPMGPYGPSSFITSMNIPEDSTCCFDLNGDTVLDNAIGGVLALAKVQGFDVNTSISAGIADGTYVPLISFSNLQDLGEAPFVEVYLYFGRDTDSDFAQNLNGLGDFYVLHESVEMENNLVGAGALKSSFLSVENGEFIFELPGLLDGFSLPIAFGRLEATIDPTSELFAGGRVTLTNGKIGGIIMKDLLFEAFNTKAKFCTCIGRDVYDLGTDGEYTCNATELDHTLCLVDTDGCEFLSDPSKCGPFGAAVGAAADLDHNNDDINDSYSFGASFTGVGANLVGLEP